MKKNKDKKEKLPFRQRMFNKVLEKPINDILYVSYDMYKASCLVFLSESEIPSFEEYANIINQKLKEIYYGGVESC